MWIADNEDSEKSPSYDIVTEKEYKHLQQESILEYSDEECYSSSDSESESESESSTPLENPFANKELVESKEVENFDRDLLEKGSYY